MKLKYFTPVLILAMVLVVFISGCTNQETGMPEGSVSVFELTENPVYDTEVKIYGEVKYLGEFLCPCFDLISYVSSGPDHHATVEVNVWYDLMVEDDGTERPSVSVEGIENGDWVILTGELRSSTGEAPSTTFWASSIEKYGQEEYCTKKDSGERMSLTGARQIALASECGEQGALKGTYMCNQDTGTWWIDLDIEKEGCSPACVVNVATKRTEINWRCTGVESKECVTNDDCVVFGKTGDCNSGCFNRSYIWESGGECFRSAPVDCKCVDSKCEGIFEGEMSFEEARQIAEQSECMEEGNLTEGGYWVGNSWWVKMDVFKEGCDMVCAVNTITKETHIDWRCPGVLSCAKDGEQFSAVYEEYPEHCCEGLTEWQSGFDTSISIADECYETGIPSGLPVGICITCGDGVCGNYPNYLENPCNCPEDCAGKNKSSFPSIEEFCQSNDWNYSFSGACEDTIKDFPICELC